MLNWQLEEQALWIKPPHQFWRENTRTPPPSPYYMLEAYDETPISIPVDIVEDVVKLVARKLMGSLGDRGMDSEAIQDFL